MKMSLILSLVVFPGAGQCLQGRKLVGILFGLVFLGAIVMAMSHLASSIITLLKIGLDGGTWMGSFLRGLAWFAAALVIHGSNVFDVILADRRSSVLNK